MVWSWSCHQIHNSRSAVINLSTFTGMVVNRGGGGGGGGGGAYMYVTAQG